uniref:hypothetical protein n=1 Tax=Candidatus Enterovibrio escicola TaxID=1927127 RepID=UPI00168000FE|nr:hypothetical protein [Candidatus Enterovibrio escacola]
MQGGLVPFCFYLTHRQARPTGIAFVDSSKLQLYHNLCIFRHHVYPKSGYVFNRFFFV